MIRWAFHSLPVHSLNEMSEPTSPYLVWENDQVPSGNNIEFNNRGERFGTTRSEAGSGR